ncbi:MAG TPA: hypothetical protein VFY86_01790 [Nocardioides sp.]|nr:hypothetical protein [Nocardioides sp.]
MTGFLLIVVAIVAVAAVLGLVLAIRSSAKPRYESLGAPPEPHDGPLIRTESRHHDTPAGADLDLRGGREHGRAP